MIEVLLSFSREGSRLYLIHKDGIYLETVFTIEEAIKYIGENK
jgi:hypothetical protein